MRMDSVNGGFGFAGNIFVLVMALIGLYWGLICILLDVRKWFWEGRPAPPKSPPYRVIVETGDGWPMRTFFLSQEEAGLLVRNLERDRDRDRK